MEEKSFLSILDEYFSNIDTSNIIKDKHGNIKLDMSWLFTEGFDREVIKEALSKIMQRVNKNYVDNIPEGKKPEDIDKFVIGNLQGTPFIQFEGADAWTKLNVTETGEKLFNIPTISVNKFNRAIAAVLTIQKIKNGEHDIISAFVNNGYINADITNVSGGMNTLAENLKSYFTYLYELEDDTRDIVKSNIIFQQRSDNVDKIGVRRNSTVTRSTRHNELIPMTDRIKLIESDRTIGVVNASEMDKDDRISAGYMVYAMKKPLESLEVAPDGTLFICEPVQGDKCTRIMYLPKEDFDIESDESPDKHMGDIAKEYLEMSLGEFLEHKNTVLLFHTAYETFKDRLEFFIDGKNVKSVKNKEGLEKLRNLYGDQDIQLPYYKPREKYDKTNIRLMLDNVLEVDATAQEAIKEKDPKTQEVTV